MSKTSAVYYRDPGGNEPVDEFIGSLGDRQAAKIDHYIAMHLDSQDPAAPPPEYPITSQIDGELRELRVRFAKTRYRILYQRSANLVVLLHGFEKNTGAVPEADVQQAIGRMNDFVARMDAVPRKRPRAAGHDATRERP